MISIRAVAEKITKFFFIFLVTFCCVALVYTYCSTVHLCLRDAYPHGDVTPVSCTGLLVGLGVFLHFVFGICALPFIALTALWFGILIFSSRPERYLFVLLGAVIQYASLALLVELVCGLSSTTLGAGWLGYMVYSLVNAIWIWDMRWLIVITCGVVMLLWYGMYVIAKRVRTLDECSAVYHHSADDSLLPLPNEVSTESGDGNTILATALSITSDILVMQQDSLKAHGNTLKSEKLGLYLLPSAKNIFSAHVDNRPQKYGDFKKRACILKDKLETFGINGNVVAIKPGPLVTLYEYQPHVGVKISKITGLSDDLALALQAKSLRIIAPIPGKGRVGFEVANQTRSIVSFGQLAKSPAFKDAQARLPLILGKSTSGENVVIDLSKTPHLLVAGSTGSGKSVGLNGMLASILLKQNPSECKLVLIDPKRLEFAPYAHVPHLLFPVITNPKDAVKSLAWLTGEMERRYEVMARHRARNIADYNRMSIQNKYDLLPYIVVVIDELADLMMVCAREVEHGITRLTQMARAAGIHMILATQRPSVDVITGLIKVNVPSRIAFRVASKVDSRTILGLGGAEKLLGQGDMLLQLGDGQSLKRVHGAYIDNDKLESLIRCVAGQASPEYIDLTEFSHTPEDIQQQTDDLLVEVEAFIQSLDEISISLLQRKFRIGYNRSARLIDLLEQKGLVLPPTGAKMRKVVK